MFWIKRNTVERQLADAMGFEYCTLFDSARKILGLFKDKIKFIPSNVCPVVREVLPNAEIIAVRPDTGLCAARFQLYGYRQQFNTFFEVDPHMTGFLREPCAANSIISFGHKKMLDIGGGGALLSNEPFGGKSYFPRGLREHLKWRLRYFRSDIAERWEQIDRWDRYLGDSCVRVPQEQIMPWRVMRRIPNRRDAVVMALRNAGYAVGTNYPPLLGVTDPYAIRWGMEVINFFPEEPDIRGACEIVKRVLG